MIDMVTAKHIVILNNIGLNDLQILMACKEKGKRTEILTINRIEKLRKELKLTEHIGLNSIKRKYLYNSGLNITHIANTEGVTKQAISHWIIREKLNKNEYNYDRADKKIRNRIIEHLEEDKSYKEISNMIGIKENPIKDLTYEYRKYNRDVKNKEIKRLYNKGFRDFEIAEELGIPHRNVTTWRDYRELPSNYVVRLTYKDHKDRQDLYNKGMTDIQISKELGVSPSAISNWRKYKDLDSNSSLRERMKERKRLWSEGYTDRQISEKTGHNIQAISVWRKREGLEPN